MASVLSHLHVPLLLLSMALLNSKQQETHFGVAPAVSHRHVSFQQPLCCLNGCFSASSTMGLSYSLKGKKVCKQAPPSIHNQFGILHPFTNPHPPSLSFHSWALPIRRREITLKIITETSCPAQRSLCCGQRLCKEFKHCRNSLHSLEGVCLATEFIANPNDCATQLVVRSGNGLWQEKKKVKIILKINFPTPTPNNGCLPADQKKKHQTPHFLMFMMPLSPNSIYSCFWSLPVYGKN